MNLKGTKTEQNLQKALAGESEARLKYEWFASQAKKDGLEQIAAIFLESSANEKEHAKLWYKALHGDKIDDTPTNLSLAAAGENYEWSDMYLKFAQEAEEEGFTDLAQLFKQIGDIERQHEERYQKLLQNIKDNKVFQATGTTIWICRNCGYTHTGETAPEKCPACSHPQSYFEIRAENY
jgi:rubrerythrin